MKYIFYIFQFIILFILSISPAMQYCAYAEDRQPKLYTDTSQNIKASINEEFVVSLPADRVGGYEWQFAKPLDQNMLNLVSNLDNKDANGKGKQELRFKALNKGSVMISLKYARSGERDMYPLEGKTFIVIVE